jgi:hypothetical protein
VFQDHDFSASTALQDHSRTRPVETNSYSPGSPTTSTGCTLSPLPKAVSGVMTSRPSQGTQRATVLKSNPNKAQFELQVGKKKMATAPDLYVAKRKVIVTK